MCLCFLCFSADGSSSAPSPSLDPLHTLFSTPLAYRSSPLNCSKNKQCRCTFICLIAKKKRKHCDVARARSSQLARARSSQLARARPSPFASAPLSACERSHLSNQPRVLTISFRRTKTTEIKTSLPCPGELLRAGSNEPPEEISPEQGRLVFISVA